MTRRILPFLLVALLGWVTLDTVRSDSPGSIVFAHRGGRVMEPTTGALSEAALEHRVEKLEAGAR